MELAFVETMRGTLSTSPRSVRACPERSRGAESGTGLPVDFHVRASGGARGHFSLAGVVHAPPWVDEATCEGTLIISLRALQYDVRFRAADGRRLLLHGKKSPSLFSPVRSMTVLPIALSELDGPELARGELTFDLLELPEFLASWLPRSSRAHRQLVARRVAVSRTLLTTAREGER